MPGASATLRPVASVTVQATTESSVAFLPSTSSTRTVVTFAGAERRARVVVGEDPVVRPAVLRVAVGAPLAEAEAVPPAMPSQDEDARSRACDDRRGRHGRRPERARARREQRGNAACREENTDDAEPEGETTPAVREHAGHGSRAPRRHGQDLPNVSIPSNAEPHLLPSLACPSRPTPSSPLPRPRAHRERRHGRDLPRHRPGARS